MALSNDDVLANVFAFVGSGHYYFVANINTEFRDAYKHYLRTTIPSTSRSLFFTTGESITESEARAQRVLNEWTTTTSIDDRNRPHPHYFTAVIGSAARRGNLPVIKGILHPDRRETFERLQWNHQNAQNTIYKIAARQGYLNVLQYAMAWGSGNRVKHGALICHAAAGGGQLHTMQWARKNGCRWSALTCSLAAKHGHLHILQWARENGCPWDARTCWCAAEHGYLHILQWARENGCPWDARTCALAAEHGHLDILQWARAHGCPWGSCTCMQAAAGGHLHILQWALAQGCPWNPTLCLDDAAYYGNWDVVQWIEENSIQ